MFKDIEAVKNLITEYTLHMIQMGIISEDEDWGLGQVFSELGVYWNEIEEDFLRDEGLIE